MAKKRPTIGTEHSIPWLVCYLFDDEPTRSKTQLESLCRQFPTSNIWIAPSDCERYSDCIVTSEKDFHERQRMSDYANGFDAGWHGAKWDK